MSSADLLSLAAEGLVTLEVHTTRLISPDGEVDDSLERAARFEVAPGYSKGARPAPIPPVNAALALPWAYASWRWVERPALRLNRDALNRARLRFHDFLKERSAVGYRM